MCAQIDQIAIAVCSYNAQQCLLVENFPGPSTLTAIYKNKVIQLYIYRKSYNYLDNLQDNFLLKFVLHAPNPSNLLIVTRFDAAIHCSFHATQHAHRGRKLSTHVRSIINWIIFIDLVHCNCNNIFVLLLLFSIKQSWTWTSFFNERSRSNHDKQQCVVKTGIMNQLELPFAFSTICSKCALIQELPQIF